MKYICLLIFSFLLCYKTYSQDSILLHAAFLPMHVYGQSVEQKFHMVMNYSGSDSLMNVLKKKGITNPVTSERAMNMKAIITTGSFNTDNKMPVQLEFIKSEDKDGNTMIPTGTKMMGTILKDNMPVYDSVVSDKMDQETKTTFLETFKNILSQISFPDKKMAVGDTLNQSTPLSFPMGPVIFKMIFSTTYKLISFDDRAANFNIDMQYTMTMDHAEMNSSGGGEGHGVMIMDLKNNYPLKYTSDYTLDLTGDKKGITIHVKLDGSSDNENVIGSK